MARALAGLPSRRSTLACALAAFVCAGALPARAADKSTKDKAAAEVADLQLEPLTAPAVAPPSPPAHWSTISGETVSPGPDLLSAELGFPGLSFGYARGLSDRADWGLKLDLLYGLYGTTTTQFGVGARVPLRLVAARREKITVLLHLDPGLVTYLSGSTLPAQLGATLTPGVALGFQVLPELRLALCADLPMVVQVLHGASFVIGPQFGFGAEYFIDRNTSVGLDLRFGPLFVPTSGADARLAFVSQVAVGHRL